MLSQTNGMKTAEARRLLIERVASSRYINRSARLRDLLLYLTARVLDDDVEEIHEQEVGHKVFGRRPDYDTGSDNIVRVHASMLRKRLEQYFAEEGAHEPLLLEIPKGNYAPVFRDRPEPEAIPFVVEPPLEIVPPASDRRLWVLGGVAALFACSTAVLLVRGGPSRVPANQTARATVALFWLQIFRPDRPTDIVLDDAALALYQELTGRPVNLSNYFDRAYLRSLTETAASANLDPQTASSLVLRRQSSFAAASFLWKLSQLPGAAQRPTLLRFAREYSFRELKANHAVLIGNSRSNPWIEPFESKLGLRWTYDKAAGTYYPTDTWAGDKQYRPAAPGDTHEGYCAISLLPNLGGSGNVLLIAGTGGSAINAGADFLGDEQSLSALRSALPATQEKRFPYFEALIRVKGRSALPRDATIVIVRTPGK